MDKNNKSERVDKFKNKLILIMGAFIIVSVVVMTFMTVKIFTKQPKEVYSAASISQKISQISELAVTKVQYRDIVHYESGEIPFITKKACNMIYDAEAKVGLDLSKVKVDVNGDVINITMPEPQILDISIDENSIQFYDEKFALFNWQNKNDTVELIKFAKNDVQQKCLESSAFKNAKQDGAKLIKALIEPLVNDDENSITINIK